jgi:hypothetical protein
MPPFYSKRYTQKTINWECDRNNRHFYLPDESNYDRYIFSADHQLAMI